MKDGLKNIFFKIWYWYVSTIDKNEQITFMNYGYSKDKQKLDLKPHDELNRYSIQLYNLVATGSSVKEKDILEIGCGRGGGLSYVKRYLSPKSVTGIDLNKKAIKFCNHKYADNTSKFFQSNAQKLDFKNESFDVILNVESSHRYPQVPQFLDETYRVLKKGGHLLFTDFRDAEAIEELKVQIKNAKFQLINEKSITANVVEALKLATPSREALVNKLLPKFLRNLGRNFAAMEGTKTYNSFNTGQFEYVFYVLKK